MTVTTRRAPRLSAGGYQLVVWLYLAGLVVWLVLGLLPPLAEAVSPVHHLLMSVGDGSGPLAGYARRVLEAHMTTGAGVGLAYVFSLLNLTLGVLLMVKRPHDLVPRLLALAFMGTAATFNEPSHEVFHILGEPPLIKAVHFTFHVVSGSAYLMAVVLFPTGSSPLPRSWGPPLRRLVAWGLVGVVALICWRSSFIAHPPFFVVFFGVLIPVVGIAAQTVQLRRRGDARTDEQSRLLRTALLPALTIALVWLVGHAWAGLGHGGGVAGRTAAEVQLVFPAVFAVVPVMLVVAIARHRLWDIDLVVSRALLVATLLGLVTVVYVAVVAFAGVLFRDRGWSVLVPLVIVACVAEPIRERCEAICNQLVFGQRMTPRDGIRSLVDRFSGVGDVDELTELTRVVVQSTRASEAAIWLRAPDGLVLLARHPEGHTGLSRVEIREPTLDACREALRPAESWPVAYGGDLLAVIAVRAPRGVALIRRERQLLEDLSHHAGLLVRNAQLTVELAHELDVVSARAEELRSSRRDVVLAQDRERSRLERDIHDGAQQQLVALLIMLRGLRRRSGSGRLSAAGLDEVRSVLVATQASVRDLSTGGAPVVLLESGLEAALTEAAAVTSRAGTDVEVRVAAASGSVETDSAVYFCCLEALQNAVKHASARRILIRVAADDRHAWFTVADDGAGFEPESATAGSGLGNLAARLLPFGGRVVVESAPGRGTTVRGELPLTRVPRQRAARESLTAAGSR